MPGKRHFRYLALLFGVVAGLAVAEVGLRLTGAPASEVDTLAELAAGLQAPGPAGDCRAPAAQAKLREIVDPSRYPDLVYELRPRVDTCFEQVPVKINSLRVRRSSDVAVPKPRGTYRVLVLGDSHAFGWAITEDATAAAQLEAVLGGLSVAPVEVVNAGVPGYNAYQEAAWLEAHGARFEPDCVLVLFVANDMGLPHFLLRADRPGPSVLWDRIKRATGSQRWFTFAPNALATFVSDVDMDRVPERYRHMVGEEGYREALRKLARWAGSRGVDLVDVFDYRSLAVDAEALSEFQEDLGIVALDMPWPTEPAFRVSAADPHLNRAGNARAVDLLVADLDRRGVCLPPEGRVSTR